MTPTQRALALLTPKVERASVERAVASLEDAATAGDHEAATALAVLEISGELVARNVKRGLERLAAASSASHAEASRLLGDCYAEGVGVPVDGRQELRLYLLAAEQGDVAAMARLGAPSRQLAAPVRGWAEWLRRAARLGEPRAQYDLARAYEYGVGVRRNRRAAASWYRAAAGTVPLAADALHELEQEQREGVDVGVLAAGSVPRGLVGSVVRACLPGGDEEYCGILLEVTAQFSLLQLLDDFEPDGWLLIPHRPWGKLVRGASERLVERVLRRARVDIQPTPTWVRHTLAATLRSAGRQGVFVTLSGESEARVLVGRVEAANASRMSLQTFDSLGSPAGTTSVAISDVLSVQCGSRYAELLIRYGRDDEPS